MARITHKSGSQRLKSNDPWGPGGKHPYARLQTWVTVSLPVKAIVYWRILESIRRRRTISGDSVPEERNIDRTARLKENAKSASSLHVGES